MNNAGRHMQRGWNGGYWVKYALTTLGLKAFLLVVLVVASVLAMQPLFKGVANAYEAGELIEGSLSETLDGHRVTVEGELPPGSRLQLEPVDDTTVDAVLENVGVAKATSAFAADITVVDAEGNVWQPADLGLQVSIENLDLNTEGYLGVVHVLDDADAIASNLDENAVTTEDLTPIQDTALAQALPEAADAAKSATGKDNTLYLATIDDDITAENNKLSFDATSFSVYIVVEGETHLRTYRFFTLDEYGDYVEYAFYTDAGQSVFAQTIKTGEKPVVPQNPVNAQDPSSTFAGWYEDVSTIDDTDLILSDTPYDFDNIPPVVEDEQIRLYARFTNYAYIIFHDQYDTESGTFPISNTLRVELEEGVASVDLSHYSVVYTGGTDKAFAGWSYSSIKAPGATYDDAGYIVSKLGSTIEVTETTHLYPVFDTVNWLSFYVGPSGSGSTYYPDTSYFGGEGPATLGVPTRNATSEGSYSFTGWYVGASVDEDGETNVEGATMIAGPDGTPIEGVSAGGITVSEGKIILTSNATLYAGWEESTLASYSVVILKQKASDAPNTPDAEKEYEYAESFILEGHIGETVSAEGTDYLTLNNNDSYNALHQGADVTDETNPYHDYVLNTVSSELTDVIVANGSAGIYLRYDWTTKPDLEGKTFTLTFADTQEYADLKSEDLPLSQDVVYGATLADYVPADPVCKVETAYRFTGWYADEDCTLHAFFDQESYDACTDSRKTLYASMPPANLTVYAGWEVIEYRVNIDPNYGALYSYVDGSLVGTGATYFNGSYINTIQEYSTVTRDYVESDSGTWYYVKHDRSNMPNDRRTYYTQDPSEATEFTTFEYKPGVYRYAGWYEVLEDGSEVPYEFGQPVDHETTIKLHWARPGAFYLQYDAGIGSISTDEELETIYVELDGESYSDNADVVVTRTAKAPEGYEFVGWTIRGDESGKVYYPGQSFTLLTKYSATVLGKKTVYMDAVYTRVATAGIVYHANGGTMDASLVDYGHLPEGSPTPSTSYNEDEATFTISNLSNNSQVYLSDGSGLSMEGAEFVGWSASPSFDLADDSTPVLYPGETYTYNVDTNEPVDLYAVWKVSVRFHLNASEDDANFGGDWGEGYTCSNEGNDPIYTTDAYLGSKLTWPPKDPVYTGGNLMFNYWAIKTGDASYTRYDFDQPLESSLDLYAVYGDKASVTIHVWDSSETVFVKKDSDWNVTPLLYVDDAGIEINAGTGAANGWNVPGNYVFAFATVVDAETAAGSDPKVNDNPISKIYYSPEDNQVHVAYESGKDEALNEGEEIYFIYYQQKALTIHYVLMDDDGDLSEVTSVSASAPSSTTVLGEVSTAFPPYAMQNYVTQPLAWVNDAYGFYSFAVGDGGDNAFNLMIMTDAHTSDDVRPELLVKNSWREFQYSTDGGKTWYNCGYDPDLYVVYYTKQPTIVTFHAQPKGYMSDKLYLNVFNYKIDKMDYDTGEFVETLWDTETKGEPVELFSDSTYSTILFTDTEDSNPRYTQRVTIKLSDITSFMGASVRDQFTTTVDGIETTSYSYTANNADELGKAKEVTFVNTRNPVAVELHVVQTEAESGRLILQDSAWRSDTASDYTLSLALGQEIDLNSVVDRNTLAPYAAENYAGGPFFFGTQTEVGSGADSWTRVDPAPLAGAMNGAKIAFEAEGPGSTVYNIYLKDANGNRIGTLDGYNLYCLYSPLLTIHYMLEGDNGELTPVGTSEGVLYGGSALTLNGALVSQNQKVEMPAEGMVISQDANSSDFNMPPLLDQDADDQLNLVYEKIAVASQNDPSVQATNTSQLSGISEDKMLYLGIANNRLSWSYDGIAWSGEDGGTFSSWPVVYALYRERGYDLTVTKRMSVDTGYDEPFTVTISSTAINRSSYAVEGTGNSTIAATPATGTTPGTIIFSVVDGSEIRISGLGKGAYTITESDNTNFALSAQVNGSIQSVTDNTISLNLNTPTQVALTNSADYICQVEDEQFHTLSDAVEWITRNSSDLSETIELLCDYLQPASDTPVIPEDHDITLTSAGENTYTITRKATFTSGYMVSNSGTLTLENIVLDGNGIVASGAMIGNAGTLVVGDGSVLTNAINIGNGGAINSWAGSVEIAGGSITNNLASCGGALYASAGTVSMSGGTIANNTASSDGGALYSSGAESIAITGGSILNNSAENGGGVYISTGTLDVSAATMSGNAASKSGGAIYAANAVVTAGAGAQIGGSGAANTAKNGGGIYIERGAVVLAGGNVAYNNASQFGGGINAAQGSVTVSSGNVEHNTAAFNGGGIYSNTATVSVSGGSVRNNTAANGGGIYVVSGATTLSGSVSGSTYNTTVSNNTATSGNGGGVYLESASLTANTVGFTGNAADAGKGGALWVGSGTAALSSCSFTGNSAVNGGAVFTDEGSATFAVGSVTNNSATNGGAIGVGGTSARLYFSGNITVKNNTLTSGGQTTTSNVYLDQDTDTIINASGLGSSASVGIYVPGEPGDELFDNRSMPGSRFGMYSSTSNVVKFKNDRAADLSVQTDTNAKKLYWGKAFKVEVRYLASFGDSLTTVASGTSKYTQNSYFAPSGMNAASEIADDLRTKNSNVGSTTAVFAAAFVGTAANPSFADYITDVNWNSETSAWEFVKRDGSKVSGTSLTVYFAEPAYISIENNSPYALTINDLSVYGHTVCNSATEAGYGYVFAKNDSIQDELYPITANDLKLDAGKTVKLLFPGGRSAAYTLNGSFTGAGENIPLTLNGTTSEIAVADAGNFNLSGTTLSTTGGTYSVVFGGSRAICRIVVDALIAGVQSGEIAGQTTAPNSDGSYEYTFSSFNQAKTFIEKYHTQLNNKATIEMLVDYLVPSTDDVNFSKGYDITITTAIGGTFTYSDDASARATISRNTDNMESLITITTGGTGSKLTLQNLLFDGKSIGGTINGGIIRTKDCDVTIDNCDFTSCTASNGGAMYIDSNSKSSPAANLNVTNCNFTSCITSEVQDKYGGGAIWARVMKLTVENCSFTSCSGIAQAGAVFHNIEQYVANSATYMSNCRFVDCTSKAAGGIESDACSVTLVDCYFERCTASERNGGALNVYSNNAAESTNPCSVTVIGCTFDDCHANKGNGGAIRSTARNTTITDCVANNCSAQNGGAYGISNSKDGTITKIEGCSATGCIASEAGGGIYCNNATLQINTEASAAEKQTTIKNCSGKVGGGIWHAKDSAGSSTNARNVSIENCSATGEAGGGIHERARTVVLDNVDITNCTTVKQGGGIYIAQADATGVEVTLTNCSVQDCAATLDGGGFYHTRARTTLTMTNCSFERNTSGGAGGGVYTDATTPTFTNVDARSNASSGNGGGICHNLNSSSAKLVVDGGSASDNSSGGMGGGIYTLSNLHLKGGVMVMGNSLTTDVADNAAGVYLSNGRKLYLGTEGATENDSTTVAENLTVNGVASNLRLPMSNAVNANSVTVYCGLDGEIRVVNAAKRTTQFGLSSIAYPYGFSDLFSVFKADDDSLYGILKRSDGTHTQIIWAEDPICKITDANGRLLYVDQNHAYPAVFDQLDNANKGDTTNTTAFSLLRQETPALYDAQGRLYTGSTYQVKMLVEEYVAEQYITSLARATRTVVLTTAGSNDSLYPYRGREGTRSTIMAGTGIGNNNLLTPRYNLVLQNIVLDGGSTSEYRRTPDAKTRLIESDTTDIKITLGRNATLQNAECTGDGGAVSLNAARQTLIIEGGTIRNCTARRGGGVFIGQTSDAITMTGGTITRCNAVATNGSYGQGGGIYLNCAFTMTGGNITRCTAEVGAGAYVANSNKAYITMSGGGIASNNANSKGGGIAVGGASARLNFSGAAYVYGNTSEASLASNKACNVEMDQGFSTTALNPGTVIRSYGLIRGAAIGVYVPDAQYTNHGDEEDPFGTYAEGANTNTLHYFVNDRNGLKGGRLTDQAANNYKMYWIKIYSLEVSNQILSDDANDMTKEFSYTVTLTGTATGNIDARDFNGTYGDMTFENGVTHFTLKNGETKVADLMPLGFSYVVTENISEAEKEYYKVTPGISQEGHMTESTQYVYSASFVNLHAICKITDNNYGLLYYLNDGEYQPAVYSVLQNALNAVRYTDFYYKEGDDFNAATVNTGSTNIEMLVDNCELASGVTVQRGTVVTLTTADPKADDGFPYVGSGVATIARGYDGESMLSVKGNLTLGNIVLDGRAGRYYAIYNGGLMSLSSSAQLTLGTGATLCNSQIVDSANGAGIYLAEGSKLNIFGAPRFFNNVSLVDLGANAENGGEAYTQARQDIYIAGYAGADAASLVVTDDITASDGSIWVWAEDSGHYKQSNQFAVLANGSVSGLEAFRNARTDADSENPLYSTPAYLTGLERDGKVFWTGATQLTISKTITGRLSDTRRAFDFTVGGLVAGESYSWQRSTIDGSAWTAADGVASASSGDMRADANGKLTFKLRHNETIVLFLPGDASIVVSEDSGLYSASYVLDGAAAVSSDTTAAFVMTSNRRVDFTNDFSDYADTDLNLRTHPYLGLLVVGVVLALGAYFSRSRFDEATVEQIEEPFTDVSAPQGAHFSSGAHFRKGGGAH